jgi:FdhE protein
VAGGFLSKLWGRSAPPSAEVQAALAELDQLARERPTLAGPIGFLQSALPVLFEEPAAENAPPLSAAEVAAKLGGGVPLLRGAPFTPKGKALERGWQRLCVAVQGRPGGEAAPALAEAVRQRQLDLAELVLEVLAGRPEVVSARADQLGLDAGLTAAVLRLVAFPVLSRVGTALEPLREKAAWKQGFCPTCGSWPLLGEFRGLEQVRFLRCGWCASAWEFSRMQCPFCGTADHEALGYVHVEGEEARQQAATCEQCRGYVKMVTTLAALDGPRLLVADVATLHLDLIAAQRGLGGFQ